MSTASGNDPRSYVLEINLGGGCFVPYTCLNVSGFPPSPVTTTEESCFGSDGKPKVVATYRTVSSERSSGTISGRAADILPLVQASQLIRESGCFYSARIAIYCANDRIGDPSALVGYFALTDLDLGSYGGIEFSRDVTGTTESVRMELSATASGDVRYTAVGAKNTTFISSNLDLTTLLGTPSVLVAVYNCGDSNCKFSGNCGTSKKFSPCDHWYAVANTTSGMRILETYDRGVTWAETARVDNVNVVNADCMGVYTDEGRLRRCGTSNVIEKLPTQLTPSSVVDGAYNTLLYKNSGVYIYNTATGLWEVSVSDDDPLTTMPTQRHIATDMAEDGSTIVTGGESHGGLVGAVYQVSTDKGQTWEVYRYNEAGWSTITDTILDVQVSNGVIYLLVTNGVTTKLVVSDDGGVTFTTSNIWAGVYIDGVIHFSGIAIMVKLDNLLWVNYSGYCDCGWTLLKDYPNCYDVIAICQSDNSVIMNACA